MHKSFKEQRGTQLNLFGKVVNQRDFAPGNKGSFMSTSVSAEEKCALNVTEAAVTTPHSQTPLGAQDLVKSTGSCADWRWETHGVC